MLGGIYTVLHRHQSEFLSPDDGGTWRSGVYAGVAATGARVGFVTGVDDASPNAEKGRTVYMLVTIGQ